jgi:hypothetical protein
MVDLNKFNSVPNKKRKTFKSKNPIEAELLLKQYSDTINRIASQKRLKMVPLDVKLKLEERQLQLRKSRNDLKMDLKQSQLYALTQKSELLLSVENKDFNNLANLAILDSNSELTTLLKAINNIPQILNNNGKR